jgi:membrane fusion protein, multidrug efflux system
MFARARLEQAVEEDAITAPMRAVTRGGGNAASVLIVDAQNKVEVRNVKLGDATGDSWIVTDGLKAGERIVVEGLQKARPGAVVKPVGAAVPPAAGPPAPATPAAK